MIVTCKAKPDSGSDFISRVFAPSCGIDEDPVCGSAHCCMGDYWAKKLGKSTLKAYQASERGGHLLLDIIGNRVVIKGEAVIVAKGTLLASGF